MRGITTAAVIVAFLGITGCSGLSTTEQRVLSGGAIGAGAGALVGAASGCISCGAAIGGAVGAGAGYVYDKAKNDN